MCITFIAISSLRTCSASSSGKDCPRASAGPNSKVFGQAFFKKLAGRGVPVAHELAPTEPAGEKRCASGTRISADRAGRREAACRWHANERRSHLPIRSVLPVCHWQTAPEPAGETAGAAPPFVQRCALHCAQCEAEKGRASQKQRSDFLAAPVHMAPPGRQKSKREFCLFGGVFLRPARRAVCPGWPLFRSLPLSGLLAFVLGVSAFFLSVFRCLVPGLWVVRRFLFGLRCLLAVWPSSALFPACRQPAAFVQTFAPAALFARRALCVRIFVLFWLSVCPFCAVCAAFLSYLSPFSA